MCFGTFSYIPLLTERDTLARQGYKHVAPPEQSLLINENDFRAKRLDVNDGPLH
jgi:hypothetical protein